MIEDNESYKLFLEINDLKDSDESMACFLGPFNEKGIELWKKLGRKCRMMTAACYSDKMTVEEFFAEIKSLESSFISNMNNLKNMPKTRWPEDWMETLAAWSEMEKGDFSD